MILRLKNINKHYLIENKVITALNQINIEIADTGLILVCGSSGSGKTTLLNILSGTDFYTEGDYYINELETSSFTDKDWEDTRNKFFSFIYQDFKLIDDYSVKDNIMLAYNIAADKSNDIDSIIKKVGLESFQNKKVRYLSGGQKQRVAIARALAKNTPVILADEPTANLDQSSSKNIAELLTEISKEKLVIVSTHNEKLFASYESRKISLSDGKIIKDEKPKKTIETNPTNSLNGDSRNTNNLFGLFKNLKTSLWTYFSLFFTFLITLGVFSIGLYFTNGTTNNYETTNLFKNLSSNRYIVTRHDSSSFSDEEINMISSDSSTKDIIKNDVLADSFLQTNTKFNSSIHLFIRRLSELPKDYRGKYPQNDNEIIFANSSGTLYEDLEREYNEYYVCDDYTHVLKICYTFVIDAGSSASYAYITDNLYNELNNELLLKLSNPTLENDSSRNNSFTLYFDDLCPKDVLISDLDSLVYANYSISFTFLNNTIKSRELSVVGVSNYSDLAYKFGSRNKYVICNRSFFEEVTEKNVFQLSVFSEKLPSLGNEYNVIYPNALNDGSVNSQAIVTFILWFIIVFIVSVVLILTTFLFLKNIYKKEVKNLYIKRLLGYTKKSCSSFELLRIVISEVLAILTILAFYILSIYSPNKKRIFVLFSNLPISLVLILILFTSITTMLLLLRSTLTKSDPYKYVEVTK